MQAYSHSLKDGMFPERILSIVRHSFLKSVMRSQSGNREENICTRLLVAEFQRSVQWDKAHVGSVTKNERTVAEGVWGARQTQHRFMGVKSSPFVPSLGARHVCGASGLAA